MWQLVPWLNLFSQGKVDYPIKNFTHFFFRETVNFSLHFFETCNSFDRLVKYITWTQQHQLRIDQ